MERAGAPRRKGPFGELGWTELKRKLARAPGDHIQGFQNAVDVRRYVSVGAITERDKLRDGSEEVLPKCRRGGFPRARALTFF